MTTKIETKTATMDTKELREAFQKLNLISSRQLSALSLYALAEFANGKTTFTTTDLERKLKIEVDYAESDSFSTLLPKKQTERFLIGANGKSTVTQRQPLKHTVISRNGLGDLSLTTPPISDFPTLPTMPENLEWHTIDGKWFCSMLRIVSLACAKEFSRPVLNGIAINDGKMAAADGFRLHVLRDGRLAFGLGDMQAIIPLDTVILMIKLFRKVEFLKIAFETKEEPTFGGTRVCPNYIHCRAGNVLMSSVLIQGSYPQYEQLIPDKFNCAAFFSAPLMLQRLGMIDEDNINSGIVRYVFEANEKGEQICSLYATSGDEDKYNLSCPAKFEGEEAKIAFSYKYVFEALKPFSMCNLEITSPSSPGKLTGDIEGLTIVVMPMFVQ